MIAFKNMVSADQVITFLRQVLSRTGGRAAEDAQLYHYTNIDNLISMLTSGYIWLTPSNGKNDYLETSLIKEAGIQNLNYISFSRTNQNIAMFKMYAPQPDGVMISISHADAKLMLQQKPRIVEGECLSDETNAELYWTGVCYKDLESKKILTPDQVNSRIVNPLTSLAGAIKLSGWAYEKEVRLCASKRLYPGQKIAIKLPERLRVVLCPGFDLPTHTNQLAVLKMHDVSYNMSQYEGLLAY